VCAAAAESGPEAAAAVVAGAASVARARHASRAARSLLCSRTRTRWNGGVRGRRTAVPRKPGADPVRVNTKRARVLHLYDVIMHIPIG